MIDAASSSFWSRFWPAVVATFVGVAVGIPVALRIQGVITGQADRKAKQEDDNLRRHVLATRPRSVRSHSAALSALHDRLADPFILPLRREVLAEIGELVAIGNSVEVALTDAAGLKPPELPAVNAS